MKYLKAYWKDPSPGSAESWGGSWWFFELADDGYPARQAQRYDNGRLLLYDQSHLDDELGGLGDQPIDPSDGPFQEISQTDFESEWDMGRAQNRPPVSEV